MNCEVKFCVDCGVCLGTLQDLGKAKFNPLKRCPQCQKAHRKIWKHEYDVREAKTGRQVRSVQRELLLARQIELSQCHEIIRIQREQLRKLQSE